MSMDAPVMRPRAPLFSDDWWARWREVRALAAYKGDRKKVRRLYTVAAIGVVYGITRELTVMSAEKVREYARFAAAIISV